MNQFNIIKIYKIFTQQHGTNSIQVPIDYKPGDIGTYPGPQNKVQKFHDFVLKSYRVYLLSLQNYVKIIIKRYLKITTYFQVQCYSYQERSLTQPLNAGAKSLQSCPTLCDPIDSSPPGSSVPGILQARILEWVAIALSNACMHAKSLQLCLTL